ncbi:ketoacyl-ACP synthase III family protein [Amycolatopsis suaedae]|uniref:3-oxoacyl-ACP synthase n=1 Tax=Amycolatopsis suaedae TaxID=2510978 RepID=A0A4Q7J2W9_9PSEU|nr:ketoacyl-ACP synthase III family protein [Amycolatopsis suaedae]RZQ60926.1 3-oxoacyl-ACP synthase [Amycolatopsis suaedae]
MRTPDLYFGGIGSFLPPSVPVGQAVADGRYPAEEAEAHGYAGAAVAGDRPAPEMALEAAHTAVKRAGQQPGELDLLLYTNTWHQGPDGWPPQAYLQRHLTGGTVPAMEVRQGCNGMFGALELAASYLRADPARQAALLVAADNYGTPLIDRWRLGFGLVVGDAAAAVVLTTRPGFARLLSVCSVTAPEGEDLHRSGEPLFPPSATVGRTQDFGARLDHYRANPPEGARVLMRMPDYTLDVARQAAGEAGIELEDLARVAYVNHSREVVEYRCMELLGLPMSKSTWEFGRTIGHCGAADQILALEHLVTTGQLAPGDHVLMLGQAPGVLLSAAVVRIVDVPDWTG